MTVHLNDLISRKEAIDLMMQGVQHENDKKYEHLDNKFAYHRYLHGECCYRNAARMIEKMPSSAEPIRNGKWMQWDSYGFEDTYECTACGEAFVLIEGTPITNGYKYCPNCGAKMDERKEE